MLTLAQRLPLTPSSEPETKASKPTICKMANNHRRTSSIERASVESILNTSNQPAAAPSAHVGNSPNRAYFAMSPPPRPSVKHSRAMSYNPRPNRLSLSFPVAPNLATFNDSTKPLISTTPTFPSTPSEITPAPSPSDPSGFLVALASQERRVLELKEELRKAEDDLHKLKRQWVHHEAHKKKAEIRHMEPLQPLQTVVSDGSSPTDPTVTSRHSAEVDRRKAVLSNLNIPKETRRKFSGAHTRTLSLLSPERSNFKEPSPLGASLVSEPDSLSRSTTIPDTSGLTRVTSNRTRHSYHQGGLGQGAKQIAEDLKSGLWTFMEDLRQATVGDEAINGTMNRSSTDMSKTAGPKSKGSQNDKSRRQSPKNGSPRTWDSLTGNHALIDVADTLWSESDPQTIAPSTTTPAKKSRPLSLAAAPIIDDLDDDWSNWDSPTPKSPARWSGSTNISGPATPSSGGIERDVKYDTNPSFPTFKVNNHRIIEQSTDEPDLPKRDDIQWPALDKLSPVNLKGNLQRTMSTIMKEWEKSITPPPEERKDPASKPKAQGDSNSSETSSSSTREVVLLL